MVTRGDDHILVIGAGVSGLTSAICLAEAGFRVRVVAAAPPLQTPSMAAAASWSMYLVDDERALAWGRETFSQFERLAQQSGVGIRMINGIEAYRTEVPLPKWVSNLQDWRACRSDELPNGYVSGWRFTVPVVDMPRYLTYLTDRLTRAGVTIEIGTIASLTDLDAATILNCSGFGARGLVSDDELIAVQGQIVVVENPGIDWFFQDGGEDIEGLTYFLPHGDTVVLGGSAQPHTHSMIPDPAIAAGIIERCAAIEPKLANAKVLDHRVGIRPVRPQVRVEQLQLGTQKVIHNYGHGGSGVTLSWGCAMEILSMILS